MILVVVFTKFSVAAAALPVLARFKIPVVKGLTHANELVLVPVAVKVTEVPLHLSGKLVFVNAGNVPVGLTEITTLKLFPWQPFAIGVTE